MTSKNLMLMLTTNVTSTSIVLRYSAHSKGAADDADVWCGYNASDGVTLTAGYGINTFLYKKSLTHSTKWCIRTEGQDAAVGSLPSWP